MSAPHLHENRHHLLRIALSSLFVCCSVVVCFSVAAVVLHYECLSTFYQQIPVYPTAERVRAEEHVLHIFGIGNPGFEYYSPDDPETVETWYRRTFTPARIALRKDETAPPLWNGHAEIIPLLDDPGTRIILSSTCRAGESVLLP